MSSKIWVIVIVLLAAGVGLIVYSSRQKAQMQDEDSAQNQNAVVDGKQPVKPGAQPSIGQLLTSTPGPGATQEEVRIYSEAVVKAAVDTTTLDVTGCSPNPSVLLVKGQRKFIIKNSDSEAHILNHSKGINFAVEAKGQKEVNMPISAGPGTYGYTCDNKVSGIFLITP